MKTTRLLPCLICVAALAGCGTPPDAATYVDTNGSHLITNVSQINVQDFATASHQMVQSLLNSGVVEKAAHQPAVFQINRITNDTDQQFDTEMLTGKIQDTLTQTGKIAFTGISDAAAQGVSDALAAQNGSAPLSHLYDYSLSGKVMYDKTSAGDVKQSTYIFRLQLVDERTDLVVWSDEKPITKQGKQASIGW
jgi:penicillin-binding protein activator